MVYETIFMIIYYFRNTRAYISKIIMIGVIYIFASADIAISSVSF